MLLDPIHAPSATWEQYVAGLADTTIITEQGNSNNLLFSTCWFSCLGKEYSL